MTKITKTSNKEEQLDFFFWIGDGAESQGVTEEEFEARVEQERRRRKLWEEIISDES